ncbi:MAG: N-acetyltransferase [Gemmatimonadetes bacterium]|nr:N-acetyltransferase [Gemmatimonadota bacterium]MBI2537318.1 N-acetyltransferase [Gemmatimonadota bacterium]
MTGGVVVRPVQSAADLNRFIALPYDLYRGDPHWVPPLRMDVRALLSRKKNPFFQHAEAEYFLAQRGAIVGRITAIHNRAHNQFHDDSVGFFGFFECGDDQEVADALFAGAAGWLKARGLTAMRGPASFSTNDECGLLVEGFDTPPTLLSPHNPPYYPRLVERAGFAKARDLFQYQSTNPTMPERLLRGARRLTERKNIRLRRLDLKHFGDEVERIKRVYNAAWEKNWGFIPMTDAEIDHLAKQLKPVVVPDLVVFAERDGDVIGFAAALPDLNVALKKNPSGRLFPGIVKILWAARKISRIRILLLGLLKEYRLSGADALMYHWIWEKGYALGYRWAEAGWVLEDNPAMINAIERLGFQRYKTLRVYDRPL